ICQNRLDSAKNYLFQLQKESKPRKKKLIAETRPLKRKSYNKAEQYILAIQLDQKLLQLQPQNAWYIYFDMAENHKVLGQYQMTIKAYKEVQQLYQQVNHHENAYVNYAIGKCYQLSFPPDRIQAIKYFIKAKKGGYELPDNI